MFGGGGGMNPRKMQQMMEQMGVDFDELDATEVVIRLGDGTELHFDDADVNRISAQGQETYQVVGEPEERDAAGELAAGDADETVDEAATDEDGADDGGAIPDADVEIVAQRTGVDQAAAREALAAEDGDLAAAVDRLE